MYYSKKPEEYNKISKSNFNKQIFIYKKEEIKNKKYI